MLEDYADPGIASIDTTTAQGLLVFHMFSALAEFERSLIRERARAGLAAAKRIGRTGGRPPKLTQDDLEVARALQANPDIGATQIADRQGSIARHAVSVHSGGQDSERARRLNFLSLCDFGYATQMPGTATFWNK
jgi:DNA invertase Pin-like site-specific DNA recombinase